MLLKTYGLTIYFNSVFEQINTKKLMYWLLKFNPTLKGEIELVEVRKYPASHENTKRAGAKIVAFEGNQAFLDSLQTHPKDFPFTVRFGGNLYIRGGERIDPEDPSAVQPSRPRIKRDSVRQFVKGSQGAILDTGMTAEEEAARTCLLYTSPSPRDS